MQCSVALLGQEQFLDLDLGLIVAVVSIANAILAVPAMRVMAWAIAPRRIAPALDRDRGALVKRTWRIRSAATTSYVRPTQARPATRTARPRCASRASGRAAASTSPHSVASPEEVESTRVCGSRWWHRRLLLFGVMICGSGVSRW